MVLNLIKIKWKPGIVLSLLYVCAHGQFLWREFPCDLLEQVRFVVNFIWNVLNSLQVSNLLEEKGVSCKSLNYFIVFYSIWWIAVHLFCVLASKSYADWYDQCHRGESFWKFLHRQLFWLGEMANTKRTACGTSESNLYSWKKLWKNVKAPF